MPFDAKWDMRCMKRHRRIIKENGGADLIRNFLDSLEDDQLIYQEGTKLFKKK